MFRFYLVFKDSWDRLTFSDSMAYDELKRQMDLYGQLNRPEEYIIYEG